MNPFENMVGVIIGQLARPISPASIMVVVPTLNAEKKKQKS